LFVAKTLNKLHLVEDLDAVAGGVDKFVDGQKARIVVADPRHLK
jgi:hypothetical protein